jgi:glycosyltransferase involved in cell wall biosynthesis
MAIKNPPKSGLTPHKRPRVLCIIGAYIPGYRAGGPVKSLSSLISTLSDEVEFFVLTKDRDLMCKTPYPNIEPNKWTRLVREWVWYASPAKFGIPALINIFRQTRFDILYLNSFFHFKGSAIPLFLIMIGAIKCEKVILAPRGEFSPNALKIKRFRKTAYLCLSKLIGLHSGLTWQATTKLEATQIEEAIGRSANVAIAGNLSRLSGFSDSASHISSTRLPGPSRIVFISRIAPIKNLDFLIMILSKCKFPVEFNIYGPIESRAYWSHCLTLLSQLPTHISYKYHGDLLPNEVPAAFEKNDVFFLPTKGENFGHAIFESLSAGTPVVISDKTPWTQTTDGAITALSLSSPEDWVSAIEFWSQRTPDALSGCRKHAVAAAKFNPVIMNAVSENRRLFGLE